MIQYKSLVQGTWPNKLWPYELHDKFWWRGSYPSCGNNTEGDGKWDIKSPITYMWNNMKKMLSFLEAFLATGKMPQSTVYQIMDKMAKWKRGVSIRLSYYILWKKNVHKRM